MKIPYALKTEVINISKMQIGAAYLITNTNNFFARNFAELSTSSIIDFGLITYPTKIQVKNATIGMITLLLIKSKKSRN